MKQLEKDDPRLKKVGIVVAVIVGCCIIAPFLPKKDDGGSDTPKDSDKSAYQQAVENKCQDAATVKRFVNSSDYDIINIAEYDEWYMDNQGYYTKDGAPLVNYRWIGKDKKADKKIAFDCWAAGDENNVEIYGYMIGDNQYLDWVDLDWYDKDGNLVNME